jgi:hypothetical protein
MDRSSPLLNRKITSRIIVIHRITSLDYVIDLLSEGQQNIGVLYLFAAGPEAKYLSQYIASKATFLNHIPAQILRKCQCKAI